MRNELELPRVKYGNILNKMKRRKTNFIGHIAEGKIDAEIEVTGRQGRRCKQVLDDFKEKRGY
jgi:hypothetical protein